MNRKTIIIISIIVILVISILIISIPSKEIKECDMLISPSGSIHINLCSNFDVSFYGANKTCTFWNVNNNLWYVCDGGILVK